jgi:hypothetical protein
MIASPSRAVEDLVGANPPPADVRVAFFHRVTVLMGSSAHAQMLCTPVSWARPDLVMVEMAWRVVRPGAWHLLDGVSLAALPSPCSRQVPKTL